MKKLYHVYTTWFGEMEFFFDGRGKLLHYWALNDANWRSEYMDPLMEALGYQVHSVEATDPRFEKKVKDVLIEMGATEEDFNEG